MDNRRTSAAQRASSSSSSNPAASASASASASRFGFRAAATSTSIPATSTSKRSLSAAGLHDPLENGSSSSSVPAKRLNTSHAPTTQLSASRPTSRASSVQPRESNSSYSNSPISAKPPIDKDYELSVIKSQYEKKLLNQESRYQALEQESIKVAGQLDRMKQNRVELLEQWNEAQAKRQEMEEEWQNDKNALLSQLSTLRASHAELSECHNELQTTHSNLKLSSRTENHSLASQLSLAENKAQSLEAEAQSLREQVEKERTLRKKAQDEKEMEMEKSRKELLLLRDGGEEGRRLGEELSKQTSHIRKLESSVSNLTSENNRLKAQSTSISILQEEKLSLETKLSRFNSVQDELNKSKSRAAQLEEELREWKGQTNLFKSPSSLGLRGLKIQQEYSNIERPLGEISEEINIEPLSTTNVDAIATYLDSLRGMNEGLKLRSSSQEERIRNLKHDLKGANQEGIGRSNHREQELKSKIKDLEETGLRSKKTIERLNDEISNLNQLLKSYENESESHKKSFDLSHSKRIEILELENDKKRKRLEELEVELKEKDSTISNLKENSVSPEEKERVEKERLELVQLRDQLKNSESELNRLAEENEKLDFRVRRGEFNPSNERCLSLIDNPVSKDLAVRTSTLEALKSENEALLKRINQLSTQLEGYSKNQSQPQEGQAKADEAEAALVPRQTADNLKLEIEKLNESLKSKDKAMLRLKQVFTAKAGEYRDSVQSLFGYKIKFLDNGKVRLKSIYARSSLGTTLIFRSDEGNVGSMKLQGEANQQGKIEDLRRFWLGAQRQSVPCFLAALNMELYDMTTQAGRAAYNGEDEEED